MRVSILLFDGFTALDAVGGYEVLANVPGITVEFVAEKKGVEEMALIRKDIYTPGPGSPAPERG